MMIVAALAIVMALALPITAWGEGYDYVDLDDEEQEEAETLSGADFMYLGVVEYGGWKWTWYSERVLPGEGLTALNENGRTVNESGFVVDGEGYISIATPNWEEQVGTIVDTPFGPGKVYDYCESDSYDVYCSW